MKFVLDTNVLVVAISRKSPHYWIWQTLQEGLYEIAVTTEILAEYAEMLTNYLGQDVAYNVVETLANLPNVEHITRYYAWQLIKVDVDDNKFVDCAVAANSNAIVTEDKHFNTLKDITFPAVQVISIASFKEIILGN